MLFCCSCLIDCSKIIFRESLCFIGTNQFISTVHGLTRFCLMWGFTESNLQSHLKTIFILCAPFYKPVFVIIYLSAILLLLLIFWVIKRVFIHLFLMLVSLGQYRREIGAFYNNTLTFPDISILYLVLLLPHGSIFCGLDSIRLLVLIITLIFNRKMFFYFLSICDLFGLTTGVYTLTILHLLIILNFLEYLWLLYEFLVSVVTKKLILVLNLMR